MQGLNSKLNVAVDGLQWDLVAICKCNHEMQHGIACQTVPDNEWLKYRKLHALLFPFEHKSSAQAKMNTRVHHHRYQL